MEWKEDGYCGLYCGSCRNFMRTQDGGIGQLAVEFGMPVEDVSCSGCKSDQVAKWCRVKGLDYCIQCNDYPCKDFIKFRDDPHYPYHTETEAYLEQIRNEGRDPWLKSMKTRWSCKSCHTPYDWFQQTCKRCGSAVAGYQKPQS